MPTTHSLLLNSSDRRPHSIHQLFFERLQVVLDESGLEYNMYGRVPAVMIDLIQYVDQDALAVAALADTLTELGQTHMVEVSTL